MSESDLPPELERRGVHFLTITAREDGQRLDNFLFRRYPHIPKSRLYQMLRKGEVRCNKKRVAASYRLQLHDQLRLPPLYQKTVRPPAVPPYWLERVRRAVVYEDERFLLVNKPAGLAVHGGSGNDYGLMEALQALRGPDAVLLGHRIDRDTSGLLVLAKSRAALLDFQEQLKAGTVEKHYLCLVHGYWPAARREVRLKLAKIQSEDGDRMVVHPEGKEALSYFTVAARYEEATLLSVRIATGRTHQIRLSVAHCGHPLAGDDKYGDREFNKTLKRRGYDGMWLHAQRLCFQRDAGQLLGLAVPPPPDALALLERLTALA